MVVCLVDGGYGKGGVFLSVGKSYEANGDCYVWLVVGSGVGCMNGSDCLRLFRSWWY